MTNEENKQDTQTGVQSEELISNALLDAMASSGEYIWQTEDYHHDNNVTAGDFLEYHLPEDFEVTLNDGTYVEVSNGSLKCGIHFSGNGDAYDHRAEFVSI